MAALPARVVAQPLPQGPVYGDSSVATIRVWIHPDSLALMYRLDSLESDHEYPADLFFDNGVIQDSVARIGFRLRGNTSRHAKKKSFKVSFNTFVSGRSFHGFEKLNLNGEHNDPSVCRAKICWDIFNAFGVPSSRAHHAKVFINGAYYGLYISVEHIDENFVRTRFGNNTGNLYKCTWPADLTWRGAAPSAYKSFTSGGTQVYEMHINEEIQDYTDLAAFITFLNWSSAGEFEEQIGNYVNVPGVLKVLAMDAALGSWDDYWFNANNFYLYHNTATGRFEFIPYDYDNTLGIWWPTKMAGVDIGTRDLYAWGHPTQPRPLAARLLSVPKFFAWYRYYLNRFFQEQFVRAQLYPRVDAIHAMITSAAEADPYRPLDYKFTVAQFHTSFTQPLGGHVPYGLKHYIDNRIFAASNQLLPEDVFPIITRQGFAIAGPDSVTITAAVEDDGRELSVSAVVVGGAGSPSTVELRDDGRSGDGAAGDGVFGGRAPRPPASQTSSYMIRAEDASGNISLDPPNAPDLLWQISGTFVAGPLAVNEFLASNSTGLTDPSGEHDDWIEIINISGSMIGLKGRYLTDNLTRPNKWALPDTTLPPGGMALIWADDQGGQGRFHAPFKLDKAGEAVGIFDSTADGFVVMDSLTFGQQETDISWGRHPDGKGAFAAMRQPTPGQPNILTGTQEQGAPALPERYSLSEPYPNPFNPSAVVRYELPAASRVRLVAYDLLGRAVRVLVDARLEAGVHQAVFDGTGLASGVYIIRLETDAFMGMRKCVLVK
jgi:hypothetical protein